VSSIDIKTIKKTIIGINLLYMYIDVFNIESVICECQHKAKLQNCCLLCIHGLLLFA